MGVGGWALARACCRPPCAASPWSACTPRRSSSPGPVTPAASNVYVAETARQLAARGVEVEVFTRATTGSLPPVVEMTPGRAGAARRRRPLRGARQARPAGQLCAFAATVMGRWPSTPTAGTTSCTRTTGSRARSAGSPRTAGTCRSFHTMHTMARVKNGALAEGDTPEPPGREIGEVQVVEAADRLVANTEREGPRARRAVRRPAEQGRRRAPGRRPRRLHPGDRGAARAALGVPPTRCAALRRPDPAAQGPGRPAAARRRARRPPTPACARGSSSASSAARAAAAWPARGRSRSWPTGSGSATSCASCRRSTGSPSRSGTAAGRRRRHRAVAQRVLRPTSPSRRRPAARPSSRPPSGGLPVAVGDAGVLVPTHDPRDWGRRRRRARRGPGPPGRPGPARRRARRGFRLGGDDGPPAGGLYDEARRHVVRRGGARAPAPPVCRSRSGDARGRPDRRGSLRRDPERDRPAPRPRPDVASPRRPRPSCATGSAPTSSSGSSAAGEREYVVTLPAR